MRKQKRIIKTVGIGLLCLSLTGCGFFGASKKKRCKPCVSPRRSELFQQQSAPRKIVFLQQQQVILPTRVS